ncbi:MAG: Clp protease N-terminal domain-containing protein, partial [Gaiellaceae bacterium]
MDFNRLTLRSQEAVAGAQELARRNGNPEVEPQHLLLALLDQELVRTLAERAGQRADALRAEAEAQLRAKPSVSGTDVQPRASTAFARVLDRAEEEMRAL